MMSKVKSRSPTRFVPGHHDLARPTIVAQCVEWLTARLRLRKRYHESCRLGIAPVPVQSACAMPSALCLFGPFYLFYPARFGALSLLAFSRPFCSKSFRPLPCSPSPCWCVLPVRLVFLCVPHAQACRKLRGTRDTTPDLCRSLCCLPRLHPSRRRCRASCWSRSIELSCFTRRPAGRDRVAVVQRARGERAMAGIALRDRKEIVQRGPSLRFMTCASERKSLSAGAFSAASLPASA